MSNLLYLDIMLTGGLLVGCGLTLYLIYTNYKERALNSYVAKQLNEIMTEAQETLEKKNLIKTVPGAADLGDPAVLATLVTVLIHKLGDVRLNIVDFANVAHEEYVSVYVDMDTSDIVLSLNHSLASEEADPTRIVDYRLTDDETYH